MELLASHNCSFFSHVPLNIIFSASKGTHLRAISYIRCSFKFNADVFHRRSAHYHPTVWESNFVQSLTTPYSYEKYGTELHNLTQQARMLLRTTKDIPTLLKLIDKMQRLGIAYHFEEEIKEATSLLHSNWNDDLYLTALNFRLLREHGYLVSSDVFDKFKDKNGMFKESLRKDVDGLLSLFEASHYAFDDDPNLADAKDFSSKHLKSITWNVKTKEAEQVRNSLELPLLWRTPRLEGRKSTDSIQAYQASNKGSFLWLDLARLDFNLVQSLHQKEVKELTRWWDDLALKAKLSYSRDRLVENYFWALGLISEPQFSKCRIGVTKFVCILTEIDDMYDIYGSLDELERFTEAVQRWDVDAIDGLPEYMKICYLSMFNFGNELAFQVLRDHGLVAISFIKEQWANLCGAYLVEARWYYSNYTPTLDEYLANSWTSVGGPGAIAHAYLLSVSNITKNCLDSFNPKFEPIYWSSIITRLTNDIGTSKAEVNRGDVAKSIGCYMMEKGVSEDKARDHIRCLINSSWKKLNKACSSNCNSVLSNLLIRLSLNMARTSHCIYQHGDGIGTSVGSTKDHLMTLIVNPIPVHHDEQMIAEENNSPGYAITYN